MTRRGLLGALAVAVMLSGCSAQMAHREGLQLMSLGEYEEGLAKLQKAAQQTPNVEYRSSYLSQKELAIFRLLRRAADARSSSDFDAAQALYERVLTLEPENSRGKDGLFQVERDREHMRVLRDARVALDSDDIAEAQLKVARVEMDNPHFSGLARLKREISDVLVKTELSEPVLQPKYTDPISLSFRNAAISVVLEALAHATGLNFVLDPDLPGDTRTTIFVKDAGLVQAIELLLRTNKLAKKMVDGDTVLVYANTPEKAKDYQELLVKSFYLGSAEAKQVQQSLQTLLKLQDIVVDEKLNLLILRDTPGRLRLAERIVAMHDVPEPEVMLEVEVLEVSRSRLMDLGLQVPSQVTFSPLSAASSSSSLTLQDLQDLNDSRIGVGVGAVTLNLRREVGEANVLANPRIRAKNREKAQILIGDRVPVITTTTTATGFAAESVQYLDVGLKLEVVPTMNFGDDVLIKVGLEVSTLGREISSSSGSVAYQIGTRNASTTLQLRDGETQILAGLISDEERSSASRIPGLGDLPIVGRLFSSQRDNGSKTEIVLSITPRIVRGLTRPAVAASEFWSGTASSVGLRPLSSRLSALPRASEVPTNTGTAAAVRLAKEPPVLTMAEPTAVSVSWEAPAEVKTDGQIEVKVILKSDGGIRSLPLQIGFDSTALHVVNIAEGDYFKRQRSETNFSHQIDQASGKIFVTASRSGTEGARGEAGVITLTLKRVGEQPSTNLKILSATAITAANQSVTPELPTPLTLNLK